MWTCLVVNRGVQAGEWVVSNTAARFLVCFPFACYLHSRSDWWWSCPNEVCTACSYNRCSFSPPYAGESNWKEMIFKSIGLGWPIFRKRKNPFLMMKNLGMITGCWGCCFVFRVGVRYLSSFTFGEIKGEASLPEDRISLCLQACWSFAVYYWQTIQSRKRIFFPWFDLKIEITELFPCIKYSRYINWIKCLL